jgi:hypothetical protein
MSSAYSIDGLPGTSGATVVNIGILSSLLLGCASAVSFPATETIRATSYDVHEPALTPSLANQFYFVDTLTHIDEAFDFERSVSNFYSKLESRQVSLGEAFERVLVDNLWDLYSRT